MKTLAREALVVLLLLPAASALPVHAQDNCDVSFELDGPGPLEVATFSVDYAGAGGEFAGDSTLPGFGPAWGTEPIACSVAVGGLDEVTILDDAAGEVLSVLLLDFDGLALGAPPILSCVFSLDSGFPCPPASAFTIGDQAFPDDPLGLPPPLPSAPAVTVSVAPRTPACGDGFVEGVEQCDDGNTSDGDCCSSACLLDAAGTPCPDASVCTSGETCDGAGACVVASTLECDDGVACTYDFCDDVLGCDSTEGPDPSCAHLASTKLDIRDHPTNDVADRLKVGAKLAPGDIGDPSVDTDYAICVFDEQSGVAGLALSLTIPAGSPWVSNGSSGNFLYKDSSGANAGVEKIALKQNAKGKGKFKLLGKRAALGLPGPVDSDSYLHVDPHVTLQIENDTGQCWSEHFDTGHGTILNRASRFKAKH